MSPGARGNKQDADGHLNVIHACGGRLALRAAKSYRHPLHALCVTWRNTDLRCPVYAVVLSFKIIYSKLNRSNKSTPIRMSHTAQSWQCRPIAPTKQASRPREAVVEGLEKCIGTMLMAIAEFKVPVPSATNCGPADMASRRRGKGHTLYDTFQSLTDVYREQNLALSRNARLDEAVKAFTSEVVDVLGIDFFRAPFGRYAHSVGLVRAEESRHVGSTPLSGLPSPPRDVGGLNEREDARDFLASRTLPKPHASNLPSRNRAEGSSINQTSHVPSSQRAASGAAAASGYRPPSPVTGVSIINFFIK